MNDELRHLFVLGREHYHAGDYDVAEDLLTQVVEKEPHFADVFNMLGVIHHGHGRFAEAEECFEKALELNPNYTEAALNLSVTYNDRGKYDEARAIYQGALNHAETQDDGLDPFVQGKLANMHAELGAVYAGLARYPEAVVEYRKALELCPEFADLRTQLGNVLRDSGAHDAAITEYSRAKKDRPGFIPARLALGVTFYSLGRREDALDEWNQALDLDPDNRVASTYLRMVTDDDSAPQPGSALEPKGED